MATIPEVIAYITFQLDQLSTRNAHHEFEHLCRHLARHRICSNILPGTGPVASGGDQGRDFETFRTYLSSSSLANSTFVGLVSDLPLAFACSLQKQIRQKIRSDITTIAQSGQNIEGVHYFCTSPITVSERHKLQDWARETHDLALEIYDCEALAEMLSDRDIFWIAVRYLDIPSELYPQAPADDSRAWYQEALDLWKNNDQVPTTYATFETLKSAVRLATEEESRRTDLLFWLDCLQSFMVGDVSKHLRRRAVYENSVALLKATGSMEGLEVDLRTYFSEILHSDHTSDIQDAATLVMFCYGAIWRHVVQLDTNEIRGWRDSIEVEVDKRLSNALGPNQRAELLEVSGFLALTRDPGEWDGVVECIERWLLLTDELPNAPLFPLEHFADRLTKFVPFIGDAARYTELTHRVDDLLAARVGEFAVAQKSRDRAIEFYKHGRVLRAIEELHDAKIKWYAEETLKGSVLAMLFISHCYRDLHLNYAAKYYSLAAALIALQSNDPNVRKLTPKALVQAAESDYAMGHWYEFLHYSELTMLSHWQHAWNAGDFDSHEELEKIWFYGSMVLIISERLDERLSNSIREQLYSWGLDDWFDELMPRAREPWQDRGINELLSTVESQIDGPLFGDLHLNRKVSWQQLGIIWRVGWQSGYYQNQRSEQLIAIMQIALSDLARSDLYLMRTTIDIDVVLADVQDATVEPPQLNSKREWRVILPLKCQDARETTIEGLSIVMKVLRDASLIPQSQFQMILEDAFQQGILSKIMVGRPYEDLYREFMERPFVDNRPSLPVTLAERHVTHQLPTHPELEWISDEAIGYSPDEASAAIQRRYEKGLRLLPMTLARLRASEYFQSVVELLRAQGWRDWHILLAVGNVVPNYRITQLQGKLDLTAVRESELMQAVTIPEDATTPIAPESEFSVERLQFALQGSMLSTLKMLGLECHQTTPDFPAIQDFLDRV